MKLEKQDFRQLRWPLAIAVVFAIAGAGALLYSERNLDAARGAAAVAKASRTTAQDRVAKAAEEEREIRSDLVFYQRMVDAGMVGTRNRLDLIEKISAIKTARKLFEIKYNIDAQKPLDYPGITPSGAMDFVTSRMQLDIMLLHEEDLINFLDDLRAAGQSLVSVRQCSLSRQDRAPSQAVAPTLQAQCLVDLITLVENKPS